MKLSGIRIVEIGQVFAGPVSTEILANLGAEIIKVESPEGGDEARRWAPTLWGEDATVLPAITSNKKSVALILKDEEELAHA